MSLSTTKKLKVVRDAQQREIAALKIELSRLHMRAFPSFLDTKNMPDHPDDGQRWHT
jgi:hypothetical protein